MTLVLTVCAVAFGVSLVVVVVGSTFGSSRARSEELGYLDYARNEPLTKLDNPTGESIQSTDAHYLTREQPRAPLN